VHLYADVIFMVYIDSTCQPEAVGGIAAAKRERPRAGETHAVPARRRCRRIRGRVRLPGSAGGTAAGVVEFRGGGYRGRAATRCREPAARADPVGPADRRARAGVAGAAERA